MSLINDALKRAKEAENKTQTAAGVPEKAAPVREPAMRVAETKAGNSNSVYLLSAALVLVLVGAMVLLWMWNSSNQQAGGIRRGSAPVSVPATQPTVSPAVAASAPVPPTTPVAPRPVPVATGSDTVAPPVVLPRGPVPVSESATAVAPHVDKVSGSVTPSEVTSAPQAVAPAVPVPPTVPAAPQFPTLKLQGIFYNSTKPSTVINGKTYFTGGTVSGARIVQIEADKVTVEWNGETRILETAQ